MDTSCFVTLFNHHMFNEKISNPPSTMLPKVSNHSCSEAHKATAPLNLSLRESCLLLINAQISFTNEAYRPVGNQRINHADLMQDKSFSPAILSKFCVCHFQDSSLHFIFFGADYCARFFSVKSRGQCDRSCYSDWTVGSTGRLR